MSLPDRYGVVGYPIAQSRSPVIHRLFALQSGQNIEYSPYAVAPGKLEQAVRQFQAQGGKGLNVTAPHKGDAARLVDEMSDRARVAGSVNTLVFNPDGIYGDNTDGVGLWRDLTINLEVDLQGRHILILGAGGATRGIIGPLVDAKPASITIANRTLAKAEALVMAFDGEVSVSACRFDGVPTDTRFDLVLNATSAGLMGDSPPYPATAINRQTICYDLSYGLSPTPFSIWAAGQGAARSLMGWGMLVEQAAESFYLWRGVRPETAPVLKQLTISAS